MPVTILDETQITPAQDTAIRELLCLCFSADQAVFSRTRAWHGSAPAFSAILEKDAHIIAHLGVVDRTICVGDIPLRIAGIQNVGVHPAHRGRQLTAQTLAAAIAEARMRNFDAALLFCIPALEPMYARQGFLLLPSAPVTRIHNGQETTLPPNHSTMFLPLRAPQFPPGAIHLMGDDW